MDWLRKESESQGVDYSSFISSILSAYRHNET